MPNKSAEQQQILRNDMIKELKEINTNSNCKGAPSEWFFPEQKKGTPSCKPGTNLYKAFTTCNNCTVKEKCLTFAVKHNCVGVWGGKYLSYSGLSKLKIKEKNV